MNLPRSGWQPRIIPASFLGRFYWRVAWENPGNFPLMPDGRRTLFMPDQVPHAWRREATKAVYQFIEQHLEKK